MGARNLDPAPPSSTRDAELDAQPGRRLDQLGQLVVVDLGGGAQSLNEIDFAVECRRRGMPEPSRQVVCELSSGRCYLDVRWDAQQVCVEINGAGHGRLDVALRDEVRIADLQTRGDAAIPVSVLTLRCDPDPFFEALKRLLASRGRRP